MSRVKNDGLDYFPIDVDFFTDMRTRRMINKFGANAAYFYLYVLSCAYKSGYYAAADADFVEDAALAVNCEDDDIVEMLKYLLEKSLLKQITLDGHCYLTSHGIQSQFQHAVKSRKRDVEVNAALWLLNEAETERFIKVRHFSEKSGK